MAGCNWTSSPAYPWTAAGFKTKQSVYHHPEFHLFWLKHELSNAVIPRGKVALVNVAASIAALKARTFFNCHAGTQYTGAAVYGDSSAKFLAIGKTGKSWTYYGWSPFYGGLKRLVQKWIDLIKKGLVLTAFDISGWDRLLTLVLHVNQIRFDTTDFSEISEDVRHKFDLWREWDEAPAVLFPPDSEIGSSVFRAHFQPSGKYDTTTTNSIAHKVIKLTHYLRLAVDEYDDTIYSDDNVSAAPPSASTQEEWEKTYKLFGLEIRDFVSVDKVEDLHKIHFLGFSPVKHWRHQTEYSPAYDRERIVWSLMNKTSDQESDKWWGLCFLAYLHSSKLFSLVYTLRDHNLEPDHPLNVLLPTKNMVMNFFDQIAFGFENNITIPNNCPRLEDAPKYLTLERMEEGQKEWKSEISSANMPTSAGLNKKPGGSSI